MKAASEDPRFKKFRHVMDEIKADEQVEEEEEESKDQMSKETFLMIQQRENATPVTVENFNRWWDKFLKEQNEKFNPVSDTLNKPTGKQMFEKNKQFNEIDMAMDNEGEEVDYSHRIREDEEEENKEDENAHDFEY